MIRFLGKLPRKCVVAFSGGVDSVAVADFLIRGKREVHLAFFNHGTQTSRDAEGFVRNFAKRREVSISVGHISREKAKEESQEEFWRNERYRFLDAYDFPVVTAHHLDDAAETWIFNSFHGNPRVIPYRRGNVIRPFLITRKDALKDWCIQRNLDWMEDESNSDTSYMRNYIRHEVVPRALEVNPGIHTVIMKKYLQEASGLTS